MQAPAVKPGPDEMFCWSCGTIIKRAAEICVHCGVRVNRSTAQPTSVEYSEKSRVAAGILGIILGGIGVHRFYLGYIGIGILQIIVSLITLGIGSLWGFIEGVLIVAGVNFRDSRGKPLKPYGVQ
jgi:TM2 domain-containing membrane protein YozV